MDPDLRFQEALPPGPIRNSDPQAALALEKRP